jgi:16S rRNA (guanine(966)-N(2))-methyltransferase RsmD
MNPRRAPPRQVRIIGGQWKRTLLPVVDAEGLRPTPDRVRETAFNWLDHLLERDWSGQRCLDLFAGSGALGFEAASRGAASVLMVEALPIACKALQATQDKLDAAQVEIRRADATSLLSSLSGPYELVFLDPPYGMQLLPSLLPSCRRLLAPGGLVYAESDQSFAAGTADWLSGWSPVRQGKAGAVHFALLALMSPNPFRA